VDNLPEDIVALLTESFFLSRFVAELTLIQELTTFIPLQDLSSSGGHNYFLSRYLFHM